MAGKPPFVGEKVKLSELCNKGKSTLRQKDLLNDGPYPVYGASGIVGSMSVFQNDVPYVCVVKDGAGVGRVMSCEAHSSVLGTMQALIPKEGVNKDYLLHLVRSLKLGEGFSGSTIPHIYFKDYGKRVVPDYSSVRQAEIALVFNLIESLIEQRRTVLEKLDQLIKSRFIEMFGDIDNTPYEVVSIQDLCEPIKDGTHQTPTYATGPENGVAFLSSKDVTTGKIDWTNIKYITHELHDKLYQKIAPRKGDVLLAKNGTTGVCAVVETDEIFDLYVTLALLRPLRDVQPHYLWAAVNSDRTKRQFDSRLKGIGVPNLHLKEIKETLVVKPPLNLQEEFASFVAQVDKSRFVVQQQIEKLQTLYDSLAQEYFGD